MTYERLGQLYSVYETVTSRDYVPNLGYLLRLPLDKRTRAVTRVIGILLTKIQSDPGVGTVLSSVFDGGLELADVMFETLSHDVDLLESAYLAACEAAHGTDDSGSFLSRLLDLDATFVERWASWLQRQDWINRHEDSRDHSFLWRRDDYKPTLLRIIEVISARPEDSFSFSFDAEVFFRLRGSESGQAIIRQRQDEFLDELIKDRYSDQGFMVFLFQIISGFPAERRRSRIATFLHYNPDFEAFRRLSLEPSSWGWEGSAVPTLKKRVDFFESLRPLFKPVNLLGHRQLVEQRIQSLRRQIEREKREDFIGF